MYVIKEAIGHVDILDYYDISEALRKGVSSSIHAGIHKKTGKEVAIKIIPKKEMNLNEIELLHGQLSIMKVC